MSTYTLTSTPPPSPSPPRCIISVSVPARTKNPYRKWLWVAPIPILLTPVCASLTGLLMKDSNPYWAFAAAGALLLFTFLDNAMQDKWLAGIRRTWLHRFTDSYMPLLLLFASGIITEVMSVWDVTDGQTQLGLVVIGVLTLIGVGFTIAEMGSLGRVLKPKFVEEMHDEVREVILSRLNIVPAPAS